MLFASLLRRLTRRAARDPQGQPPHPAPRGRGTQPRRFVPQCLALEDRSLPSAARPLAAVLPPGAGAAAQQQLPFKETLQVVSVSDTGVISYEGTATHLGRVTAVLNPDNTFTKTAANGDTASGYLTPESATTGTITITGGTGRFGEATGTSTYIVSVDPNTGATSVEIDGTISYSPAGQQAGPSIAPAVHTADTQAIPFKVTGGGNAPQGLPVFPGGTAVHDATGTATHLGKYTGEEGLFTLLSFTSETTGTFQGTFVFVAANGDRLAFAYGAETPGTFTLIPADDGKVVVEFVAEFTPIPEQSTGRFAKVTGGSFTMIATTEPFVLQPNAEGYTAPFQYTWEGEGSIEFGKKK